MEDDSKGDQTIFFEAAWQETGAKRPFFQPTWTGTVMLAAR